MATSISKLILVQRKSIHIAHLLLHLFSPSNNLMSNRFLKLIKTKIKKLLRSDKKQIKKFIKFNNNLKLMYPFLLQKYLNLMIKFKKWIKSKMSLLKLNQILWNLFSKIQKPSSNLKLIWSIKNNLKFKVCSLQ